MIREGFQIGGNDKKARGIIVLLSQPFPPFIH